MREGLASVRHQTKDSQRGTDSALFKKAGRRSQRVTPVRLETLEASGARSGTGTERRRRRVAPDRGSVVMPAGPIAFTCICDIASAYSGIIAQGSQETGILLAALQSDGYVMPISLAGSAAAACYLKQSPGWISHAFQVWPPRNEMEPGCNVVIPTLQGRGRSHSRSCGRSAGSRLRNASPACRKTVPSPRPTAFSRASRSGSPTNRPPSISKIRSIRRSGPRPPIEPVCSIPDELEPDRGAHRDASAGVFGRRICRRWRSLSGTVPPCLEIRLWLGP